MIKSVNDTNVWLAGINWDRGSGYQIRLHWEARRFQPGFEAREETMATTVRELTKRALDELPEDEAA